MLNLVCDLISTDELLVTVRQRRRSVELLSIQLEDSTPCWSERSWRSACWKRSWGGYVIDSEVEDRSTVLVLGWKYTLHRLSIYLLIHEQFRTV